MLASVSAFALVKENNDFWDTTGYRGAPPVVAATEAMATGLDAWSPFTFAVGPLAMPFSSIPLGLLLLFK